MRLTEEYKHITEHFKDLQAKFSHFQQADLNKYQAVSHIILIHTLLSVQLCVICGWSVCVPVGLFMPVVGCLGAHLCSLSVACDYGQWIVDISDNTRMMCAHERSV